MPQQAKDVCCHEEADSRIHVPTLYVLLMVTGPAKTGHVGTQNLPFFTLLLLIMSYSFKLWPQHFQPYSNKTLASLCKLQNAKHLLLYQDMTCYVTGCSLCPHVLFSQAQHYVCLFRAQLKK